MLAKIELVIDGYGGQNSNLTRFIPLISKRAYQNIKIRKQKPLNVVPLVLNNFAYCLVSINTTIDVEMNGISLPMVKELKMYLSDDCFQENGLLGSVSNLKVLHIAGNHPRPGKIVDCLEVNPYLVELVLENGTHESIKFMNSDFDFSLKILKLNRTNFQDHAEYKFLNFLLSQSNSLKELKLLKCNTNLVKHVFERMPNLEKFSFSPPDTYCQRMIPINIHLNITELSLILVPEFIMRNLLSNLPRLFKLYIATPNANVFQFLIRNVPSLREFHFAYFEDHRVTLSTVIEFYKDCCEDSRMIEDVNHNIKIFQI